MKVQTAGVTEQAAGVTGKTAGMTELTAGITDWPRAKKTLIGKI
jgi:hypothetical protein